MSTKQRRVVIVLAALVVALAVALVVVWATGGDDDGDPAPTTTTSTTATSSTSTSTSTTTTTTAPGLPADEAATVVWPAPGSGTTYADPVDAARAFATDLAGFTEPLLGDFAAGDARSGEVEVRPVETGPVTTVLVRRLGDDSWWVLGSTTSDIELDDPAAGAAIDDPLRLTGRARAFEGTVRVSIHAHGGTAPVGTGFVTGSGGGELGPFDGEVRWDDPGTGAGAIVLTTEGGDDGRVWQAAARPVQFGDAG